MCLCVCVYGSGWLSMCLVSERCNNYMFTENQVTLLNTRNTTRSVADLQFTRIVIMINAQHR